MAVNCYHQGGISKQSALFFAPFQPRTKVLYTNILRYILVRDSNLQVCSNAAEFPPTHLFSKGFPSRAIGVELLRRVLPPPHQRKARRLASAAPACPDTIVFCQRLDLAEQRSARSPFFLCCQAVAT